MLFASTKKIFSTFVNTNIYKPRNTKLRELCDLRALFEREKEHILHLRLLLLLAKKNEATLHCSTYNLVHQYRFKKAVYVEGSGFSFSLLKV